MTMNDTALSATVPQQTAQANGFGPSADGAGGLAGDRSPWIQRRWQALGDWFDRFSDGVRRVTPSWIVNNGTRINFGLKALADCVGIASAVRRGSESPARFVANSVTLASMIPGAMYEEKPTSAEDNEASKHMNPLQYAGHKLKYALNPRDHVVETVGAATMINGLLTAVSGISQSSRKQLSWEIVTGAFTMAAGAAVTFMHDRERAWQSWTAIFIGRIPFKALQSEQALNRGYKDGEVRPGDRFQAMNLGIQLVGNVFSTFYAGVKKMPNGRIVHLGTADQHAIRGHMVQAQAVPYAMPVPMPVLAVPQTTLWEVNEHSKAAQEPPTQMEVM